MRRGVLRGFFRGFSSSRPALVTKQEAFVRELLSPQLSNLRVYLENVNFPVISLAKKSGGTVKYDELINLVKNLAYLSKMLSQGDDPVCQAFIAKNPDAITQIENHRWVMMTEVEERYPDRIREYREIYEHTPRSELKALIIEMKSKLKTPSLNDFEYKAQLFAAEMNLNPDFSIVAVIDPQPNNILKRLKEAGFRTIAFVEKDGLIHKPICIADYEISVKNLNDPRNCMQELKHFLEKNSIPNSGVAVHPGLGSYDEKCALAVAVQQNYFVFIGPDKKGMEILSQGRNIASYCEIPLAPTKFGEMQERIIRKEGKPKHFGIQLTVGNSSAHGNGVYTLNSFHFSAECNRGEVIEAAPAKEAKIQLMEQYALRIGSVLRENGIRGVFTVEFLCLGEEVYFLDINGLLSEGLQVSEAILGLNLIELQCWSAAGNLPKLFFERVLNERDIDPAKKTATEMIQALQASSMQKEARAVKETVVSAILKSSEIIIKRTLPSQLFSNVTDIKKKQMELEEDQGNNIYRISRSAD